MEVKPRVGVEDILLEMEQVEEYVLVEEVALLEEEELLEEEGCKLGYGAACRLDWMKAYYEKHCLMGISVALISFLL